MTIDTFKETSLAIIGLVESEREIEFDWTNHNDVKFESYYSTSGVYVIGYSLSFSDIELRKHFYCVTDPNKVTIQGIIDAVKEMADYLEENKYIDQYNLQTLIEDRYADN